MAVLSSRDWVTWRGRKPAILLQGKRTARAPRRRLRAASCSRFAHLSREVAQGGDPADSEPLFGAHPPFSGRSGLGLPRPKSANTCDGVRDRGRPYRSSSGPGCGPRARIANCWEAARAAVHLRAGDAPVSFSGFAKRQMNKADLIVLNV